MGNQKQIEVSPLSDKEVFDEIIRRIVNEHFLVFFSETRYYEILSEHFLQGFEYDLDSLEPVQSFALEEDIRKIDEWLAFKKVYYGLEGRPGYHPLKEILEKSWIAYFKAWVLRNEGDSWAIDWILSVPLFSKNRTRSQIAELLGCTVTGQNIYKEECSEKTIINNTYIQINNDYNTHYRNEQHINVENNDYQINNDYSTHYRNEQHINVEKNVEDNQGKTDLDSEKNNDTQQRKKKNGCPKKTYQSFRKLLHVENNDELWENIHKKLQELFDEYQRDNERARIIWILCKVRKEPQGHLPSAPELAEAYKDASLPAINISTFKQNNLGSIKDKEFENKIKDCFKK